MKAALVTGSLGLIGSETCLFFAKKGFKIIGIDNDMRKYFFGNQASTSWMKKFLEENIKNYEHHHIDIRDQNLIEKIFKENKNEIEVIIHTAAQPSHDWASKEPLTDFSINAVATHLLLEMTRLHTPQSRFIFMSTNKVYGDTPNSLPLIEKEKRWEISETHHYFSGIDENMSIDQSKHSIFGASKVAADIMVQEYGRYFNMPTVVFRGGCLTGPAHSGAKLHGFLSYLVKCALEGEEYSILGYKGKQVRDNIHSHDLVNMFWNYYENPKSGEVYNAGGGRHSHCSILEAIDLIQKVSSRQIKTKYQDENRSGDHIWYVSNLDKFKSHYPNWKYNYNLEDTISEMVSERKRRQI